MKRDQFKVGQVVYIEERRQRNDVVLGARTITKIGRRWVTFKSDWQERRFDPETMRVDNEGYGYGAEIWLSEAAFHEERAAGIAWDEIQKIARSWNGRPKHLTLADLSDILAKLQEPKP